MNCHGLSLVEVVVGTAISLLVVLFVGKGVVLGAKAITVQTTLETRERDVDSLLTAIQSTGRKALSCRVTRSSTPMVRETLTCTFDPNSPPSKGVYELLAGATPLSPVNYTEVSFRHADQECAPQTPPCLIQRAANMTFVPGNPSRVEINTVSETVYPEISGFTVCDDTADPNTNPCSISPTGIWERHSLDRTVPVPLATGEPAFYVTPGSSFFRFRIMTPTFEVQSAFFARNVPPRPYQAGVTFTGAQSLPYGVAFQKGEAW